MNFLTMSSRSPHAKWLAAAFVLYGFASPVEAAPKTELILAVQGEPDTGYDPTLGWGEYGHPLMQSTLLARDADLKTQADLARSWALSPDRLTWTVTIRDDVKFSDGEPLTAADVAFTFRQAAQSGGVADLNVLADIKVRVAATLDFILKEPRITFQAAFFTLGIVPAKKYGPDYARNPIGSGPYRLVRWDRSQQLIVEANPYFYGPKPAFRRLTFLFTSEDASFAAARAGKLDIVAVPPSLAGLTPQNMKRVVAHSVDNRGLMFPIAPPSDRKIDNGPVGNAVTSDPAIRHAINVALDRKALVQAVVQGYGSPAYGPADGLPWSNPNAVEKDADPERAVKILEEAGWKRGANGVRIKNGVEARFPILYFATDSTRQMLALVAADQLKRIGIIAEPLGKSSDEVRRLTHANVVLFGWGSHNPVETYYLYQSGFGGNGWYNAGLYANPKVDAHFADAQAAATLEESFPAFRAAEWDGQTGYGMRGDAAWAWLVNLDHVYFVDACLDVGKLQVEPHGHGWPITSGILNWRWTCP